MPDISMCLNSKCERKETCWRYIAAPCKYQCYGLFDHNACKYYWPTVVDDGKRYPKMAEREE